MTTVIPIFERKVEDLRRVSEYVPVQAEEKFVYSVTYESRIIAGRVVFSLYAGGGDWVLCRQDDVLGGIRYDSNSPVSIFDDFLYRQEYKLQKSLI